jgi:ATP-dependent Clp protease ATP-binding subunit ClpA
MFGNLFNQSKRPLEEPPAASQVGQPVVPSMQQGYPQTMNNATPPVQVDQTTSKMNPAFRQNLSALSHLDQRATQILQHAQEETKRIRQPFIEPDQLLIGLLYDADLFKLLEDFSVDPAKLTREIQIKEQPGSFTGQPTLSDKSRQVFEQAYRDAKARDSAFITPEDVLLELFSETLTTSNVLQTQGMRKEQVQEKLAKTHGSSYGKKSVLDRYGIDLTQQAREGKLDPIAGRDKEIDRLVHILLRRTKNNPIIIGEAGVGKTAIIEGLAQAIVAGSAPKDLLNKRIIQLDLSSIVAGASHRGEFEERLRSVIQETMASAGQIILFIDEIHILMGAGGDGGESMNASNIIKPHLARGQLQIIGATTTTEYRKNFEKDKALERRFQPVVAEEPSEEAAVEMLKVLKSKYEKFHGVTISDATIEAAVKLSKKYIGERYLPDKAVDLLDEASAWVKLGRSEAHLPRIGGEDSTNHEELVEVIKTSDAKDEKVVQSEKIPLQDQSAETLAPGVAQVASDSSLNPTQNVNEINQGDNGRPVADFAAAVV